MAGSNDMQRTEDLRGVVVSFDTAKGFGYIKGDNGEMFFTHAKHTDTDDVSNFKEGMIVNFIAVDGAPGKERIATNITMDF
ncbi:MULTISPECIES: cold-shock protein [unclassified Planococcus (in: firmicutes)]|uniref:cold-shock protein n=1 Tax=unclassified Planococcus (in: firmicutes) TaxID=2662419 RepID=UPI001F228BF1|nr:MULTISPECIES: cold shock domain-containing protein [unclassified Planococcus (in: firmicutes)]UJF25579.1 cold shock domain-containing protein [Planococcus sp. 107-1]GKW44642.1 hypothetical protein NCCP2050_03340 [Planococcus sp. NCCP-2050]